MTDMVPKDGVDPEDVNALNDAIINAQGELQLGMQRAMNMLVRAQMRFYREAPKAPESPQPPSDPQK